MKIDPKDTVLVLIDMQNTMLHEKGSVNAFGVWKFAKDTNVIQNTKNVVDMAKKNDIPVIYVQTCYRDFIDFPPGEQPLWKSFRETGGIKQGTWDAEYVDELKPGPDDIVVIKRRVNAFYGTDLDVLLKNLNRKTLIMCGNVTNFCVESTARAAADRDYNVIVLDDCTATLNKEAQEFAMKAIFSMIGAVSTSKELEI